MDTKRDTRIRHVLFVATLAIAAGVFSANSFGMPTPAGVDALGRSSDWMLSHGLGTVPKVALGRDVNGTPGRAGPVGQPAGRDAAVKSVTAEPRSIGIFGRA